MQGEQSQGGSVEQGSVVAAPEASGAAGGEGGGGAEAVAEARREDNRHYRRQRHRDCYCRGRNKNCPKCGGTGQLLPNWRENLQAARAGQRPVTATPAPAGAGSPGAALTPVREPQPVRESTPVREPQPAGGYDRAGVQERDRGYDRGGYDRNGHDRGGQDRGARRDRWQNRNQNRGGGFQGNRPAQKSAMKMCPMCGEYVSNLRAHVLARHDD